MLMQAGSRFYHKVRSQSDVQRSALLALRWLSKDLAEGAPLSFRHYDPDNAAINTERNGLVFGSPKDLDEKVTYNDKGRLQWNSVIGYYIEEETGDLFRVKVPLPTTRVQAPQIEDSLYHIDLLAQNPDRRMVARKAVDIQTEQGIQDVEVLLRFRDNDLGHGLSVKTRLEMKNK